MKKIVLVVHLWLGLASGLIVFVLGLTGCIFCFQRELKEVFYADKVFINSATTQQTLPLDILCKNAQEAIGNAYPISFIEYRPNSDKTVLFRASKSNDDALTYNGEILYNKTAYVNPYTGKVQAVEDTKWEFFNVILHLHFSLLLNNIGHYIIGWSTVVFVILLITGIILWWPKNKVALQQRIRLKWKKTTQWKRKNYDLHNVFGFYSFLIALCISLTGLWFAFDWFNEPVKWVINGGKQMPKAKPVFSDTMQTPLNNVLHTSMRYVEREPIRGQFYFISIPTKKQSPITVTAMLNKNNFAKRSQYLFDKNTGQLLKKQTHQMKSGAEKLIYMIYDIHVGKVLGIPGQILAFLAALIAASLPVTGFFIWWGKRRKA